MLTVASSGITSCWAAKLPIQDSRFSIDLHDELTCNITQHMKVAELVHKADLITWDEAPMMQCRAFEVVDRTLRDLMQLDDAHAIEKIFGGKPWSLVGIFYRSCLLFPREDEKTLLVLRCLDRIFGNMLRFLCLHINMRVMAANSKK